MPTNANDTILATHWPSRNRRRFLQGSASFVVASSLFEKSRAAAWPSAPIHAIVPFAAGSGSDVVARTVLDKVGGALNATIIVDNRTGAAGTIGGASVAKADPDGYTLLIDSSAHTTIPFFYSGLPYDPVNDFRAIAPIAQIPTILIIASSKGIKTARELVDYAKKNPGKISYASGGAGSATHLAAERFRLAAGFEGIHVPFRGGQEGMREVLAGRVDFYFIPILPALAFIKDGALNALAVSTDHRSSVLPDVPTLTEAGYPNADYNFWVGAFGPKHLSDQLVDRLHAEITKAVQSPELKPKLVGFGAEPMMMTSTEFQKYLDGELAVNGPLIASTGMKAEQ